MPDSSLGEVLARHTPALLAIPGVIGTGEGREGDVPVIVIFVVKKTPELESKLPRRLEGHPVVVRETGEVVPYRP